MFFIVLFLWISVEELGFAYMKDCFLYYSYESWQFFLVTIETWNQYTVGAALYYSSIHYNIQYPISVYHTPSLNRGFALYYLQLSKTFSNNGHTIMT